MYKILNHCIKIDASFHLFILLFSDDTSNVCSACSRRLRWSVYIYTVVSTHKLPHIYKHIVQLDRKNHSTHTKKTKRLLLPMAAVLQFLFSLSVCPYLCLSPLLIFICKCLFFPLYRFILMRFGYIVIKPLSARSIWNVHIYLSLADCNNGWNE